MSIRPTFFGFEKARSALSAAQRAIDVTGQNLANINTPGVSRQRLNLSAVGPGGLDWRHPVAPSANVGRGVNMDSIRRIRDQFLDVRYRTEAGHVGRFGVIEDVLVSVENVLDEFMMDNLNASLTNFMNALQNFHRDSDEVEFAHLMRSAALQLTMTLNKAGQDFADIIELRLEQMNLIPQMVNSIAHELDEINHELRMQTMFNPMAISNELLDRRDLLLDQLAGFGQVTIVHDNSGPVDFMGNGTPTGGVWVFFGDVDTSGFDSEDPFSMIDELGLLVRGDRRGHSTIEFDMEEARQIMADRLPGEVFNDPIRFLWGESFPDDMPDHAGEVLMTTTGRIFGYYEMMNGFGSPDFGIGDEFRDFSAKGIPYFLIALDEFTREFADIFNALNMDGAGIDELFVAFDDEPMGARNITLSEEWLRNAQLIVHFIDGDDLTVVTGHDPVPSDARNSNILRMIDALRREDRDFEALGGFRGSFQQFIGMLNAEIAVELDFNNTRLGMTELLMMNIDQLRESVKGISEDEEAMNLARFQAAYNSAARFMTVLDEMLEIIIMRMGIVGR